jgi:hypothetical protein
MGCTRFLNFLETCNEDYTPTDREFVGFVIDALSCLVSQSGYEKLYDGVQEQVDLSILSVGNGGTSLRFVLSSQSTSPSPITSLISTSLQQVLITWGDNTSSIGSNTDPLGAFPIHNYSIAGKYLITVYFYWVNGTLDILYLPINVQVGSTTSLVPLPLTLSTVKGYTTSCFFRNFRVSPVSDIGVNGSAYTVNDDVLCEPAANKSVTIGQPVIP